MGCRWFYRAVCVIARSAALRVRITAMATAITTTAIVISNAQWEIVLDTMEELARGCRRGRHSPRRLRGKSSR
jgi:hypothetical protein